MRLAKIKPDKLYKIKSIFYIYVICNFPRFTRDFCKIYANCFARLDIFKLRN